MQPNFVLLIINPVKFCRVQFSKNIHLKKFPINSNANQFIHKIGTDNLLADVKDCVYKKENEKDSTKRSSHLK